MPGEKATFLVYASGKCVILGTTNDDELAIASFWIAAELDSLILAGPIVSNMVYVYAANFRELTAPNKILSRLYYRLRPNYHVSYEPEISPALMVSPRSAPSVKVMIFRSGKINITGLKSHEMLGNVINELNHVLLAQ